MREQNKWKAARSVGRVRKRKNSVQPTSSKKIRKHIPQEDGVVGYAEEKEVSYQESFWPRVKIEPLENIKYLSPVVKNELELQNRAYEQLQDEKINVERQMKELLDRELDYLKEDRVKEAALKKRMEQDFLALEQKTSALKQQTCALEEVGKSMKNKLDQKEENMKARSQAQDDIKKIMIRKKDLLAQLTNRVANVSGIIEAMCDLASG